MDIFVKLDNYYINIFDITIFYKERDTDLTRIVLKNENYYSVNISIDEVLKQINKKLSLPENKEIRNRFEIMDI